MKRFFRLCGLSLLVLSMSSAADPVVVVPGSNAGFLYFPAGAAVGNDGAQRFTLIVNKSGMFTDYKIVSDPPGLVIEREDFTGQFDFELGPVTLSIDGKYPAPLANLDLVGNWREDCEADGSRNCTFTLTKISGVTIEVDDNPQLGTRLEIDNDGTLLSVYFAGSFDNRPLVVHPIYGGGRSLTPLKDTDTRPAPESRRDGEGNTNRWADIWNGNGSAAKFCRDLPGNWFLPAIDQLRRLSDFPPSVFGELVTREHTWSSTIHDVKLKGVNVDKTEVITIKRRSNGTFEKEDKEDSHKNDKHGAVCMRLL